MFDTCKTMTAASLLALLALSAPLAAQTADTPSTDAPATQAPAADTPAGDTPAADTPAPAAPTADAPAEGATDAPGDAATPAERIVDGIDSAPGDLDMGAPVDATNAVGATYVAGTSGAWETRCVRTETGEDPCQLYQLLNDDQGNSVAEISLFGLPEGQPAEAGATIITPLETLLTQQITLSIDGGVAKRYPFTFCAANGCVARIGFTEGDVAAFKGGRQAELTIVPAAAPDQTITLTVSLSGFTAGYDGVNESNGL